MISWSCQKPNLPASSSTVKSSRSPCLKENTVQLDLGSSINLTLKSHRIARAYTELRCTYPAGSRSSVYGGRSVVPDVTVFTWERLDALQQTLLVIGASVYVRTNEQDATLGVEFNPQNYRSFEDHELIN